MKKIIILGAGGFAREVAWLIEEINSEHEEWYLEGFIEEGNKNVGAVLNNYKILGDFEWIKNNEYENLFYVCAVGDPTLRIKFSEAAENLNVKPAILIHPNAKISNYSSIDEGTIICAGAIITANVTIGKHVVISVNSVVSHDSIISDFTTILPSVTVSGNVKIGSGCYIGTKSAIINKINIGCNTIVGAGATVTKDLPDNCTAVGTPAKPIKFR